MLLRGRKKLAPEDEQGSVKVEKPAGLKVKVSVPSRSSSGMQHKAPTRVLCCGYKIHLQLLG